VAQYIHNIVASYNDTPVLMTGAAQELAYGSSEVCRALFLVE
jgi:hypothetical protein